MPSTSEADAQPAADLDGLSARLGHRFRRAELLLDALTHASHGAAYGRSYERLEFLGDRVLGLVVAEMLFERFPDEAEGALAKRLAMLVRRDTLARVGQRLDLGPLVRLAPGEAEAGVQENPTILADVCEALIGALYLDGGLAAAQAMIEHHWTPLLEADLRPPEDAKTALQEWVQARALPLPEYRVVAREGPPHDPHFTVRVAVQGEAPTEGQGRSKRAAEKRAAAELLDRLREAGR